MKYLHFHRSSRSEPRSTLRIECRPTAGRAGGGDGGARDPLSCCIGRPAVGSVSRPLERLLTRLLASLLAALLTGAALPAEAQSPLAADARCSDELRRRYAPAEPAGPPAQIYTVCTTDQPLDAIRPSTWVVDMEAAAEAFAGAPPEIRRTLALLFGGTRLRVARGVLTPAVRIGDDRSRGTANPLDQVDAVTLIAPRPADTMDRIVPGTLIIQSRTRRSTR